MSKKFLIIIVSVLILILLTFLFWPRSGSDNNPTTSTDLPFGSGEGISNPNFNNETDGEVPPLSPTEGGEGEVVSQEGVRFFRLSALPIAGFVVLDRGATTSVRYVERGTGHIFEYILPVANEPLAEKRRLTNTTLPKIYDALFRGDGNAVVLRTLEDSGEVVNLSLTLTPPRATSTSSRQATSTPGQTDNLHTTTSINLKGEVDNFSLGPNGSLLSILKDSKDLVSSNFDGSNQRNIANLETSGWRSFSTARRMFLQNKPSAQLPGYLYAANGGSMVKILGPLFSLSTKPDTSGNWVIYSYSESGVNTAIFNVGEERSIGVSPATLAEKCVWMNTETQVICASPKGGLGVGELDAWHQGLTSFNDYLWQFDAKNETSNLITEPGEEFGLELDVKNPQLSAQDEYFVFLNQKDLSLWAVKLP